MSAIKDFFKKLKADVKFKKAGEGHTLAASGTIPAAKSSSSTSSDYNPPGPRSDAASQAAMATLQRLEQQTKPAESRSQKAIKLQVKKMLDDEQKGSSKSQPSPSSGANEQLLAAPVLAVNGVFFTCPILSEELALPREDLLIQLEQFLEEQYNEDPLLTAATMIMTLNKSKTARDGCVETLGKILTNILTSPGEDKFRQIREGNKVFQEKVAPVKGARQFLMAAGFVPQQLPVAGGQPEDHLVLRQAEGDIDRITVALEQLSSAQAIPIELHRNAAVIQSQSSQQINKIELPDSFYAVSKEEIKREQQLKAELAENLTTLRTKEMREKDERRAITRYRYVLIRFRFPGVTYFLQGTFSSTEKLFHLQEFLTSCLHHQSALFELFGPGGEKLQPGEISMESGEKRPKTLAELGLAPAAVVTVQFPKEVLSQIGGKFLSAELMDFARVI